MYRVINAASPQKGAKMTDYTRPIQIQVMDDWHDIDEVIETCDGTILLYVSKPRRVYYVEPGSGDKTTSNFPLRNKPEAPEDFNRRTAKIKLAFTICDCGAAAHVGGDVTRTSHLAYVPSSVIPDEVHRFLSLEKRDKAPYQGIAVSVVK